MKQKISVQKIDYSGNTLIDDGEKQAFETHANEDENYLVN